MTQYWSRKISLVGTVLLLAATSAYAADAPAGASALCNDGTYSSTTTKRGACGHHGGVKRWLETSTAAKPAGRAAAAAKPNDATGECGDGTYTTAANRRGACSKHGGVKEWYASGGGAAAEPEEHAAPTKRDTAGSASDGAPSGASAQCNDGSYSHSEHHRGACSHHGGVKQWLRDVAK